MNANQVVIVMDREKAERWVSDAGQPDDLIENDIARALLRDPAELEARIAEAIHQSEWLVHPFGGRTPLAESSEELQKVAYRQAQAVLHALQEGTTDG